MVSDWFRFATNKETSSHFHIILNYNEPTKGGVPGTALPSTGAVSPTVMEHLEQGQSELTRDRNGYRPGCTGSMRKLFQRQCKLVMG